MKKMMYVQLFACCAALIAWVQFEALYKLTDYEVFSKAPLIYLTTYGPFLVMGGLYFVIARKWFRRNWLLLAVVLPVSYLIYTVLFSIIQASFVSMPQDDFGAGILLLYVHAFTLLTLIFSTVMGAFYPKKVRKKQWKKVS